ncbi:O-methyltransferase [Actinomycetospora termitidis]|uniref:O-methyltransferase n=1 Tax=Actinomycetospora termitidis TaxID=3053470 RepID=UPI0031F2DDB9
MGEDGGREGTRRARTSLRVVGPDQVPSTTPPPPAAPSTPRTTPRPADDAGRRHGHRPGRATARIPVYPRVPTGPLRLPSTTFPGRRGPDPAADEPTTTPHPLPRLVPADGPAPLGPSGPVGPSGPDGSDDVEPPTTTVVPGPSDDAADDAGERERLRTRAERFSPEDEVLAAARERAAEHGIVPVGVGAAAALTFLASAGRARAVVEIGSGAGVGTVSLLRGMPREGLLTSIDTEVSHQRLTRITCAEAGFGSGRVRMITGRALEVLPRLSDGAYDLVLVDAATVEYPLYLAEAVRLLRPGGVVALDNVCWTGRITDPARRDAVSAALRETVRAVRTDERLAPLLLPVSDGLLCASLLG